MQNTLLSTEVKCTGGDSLLHIIFLVVAVIVIVATHIPNVCPALTSLHRLPDARINITNGVSNFCMQKI